MSSQLIFNFCACLLAVQAGLTVSGVNSPTVQQQQNIEADDGLLGFGLGGEGGANTVTFNSFNNVGGISSGINGGGFSRRGLGLSSVNSPIINQQQDIDADEGLAGGAFNTVTFNSFNNVGGISNGVNGGGFNRRGLGLSSVNSPIINQQQDIDADEGLAGGAFNTVTFNSFNNVGGLSSNLNRRSPQSISENNPVINQQQRVGDRDRFGGAFETLTSNFFNNAQGVFNGGDNQKAKRGLSVNSVNSPNVKQQQDVSGGWGLSRRGLKVDNINSPIVKQQQNIEVGNGFGFLHRRDTGAEVDSQAEGTQESQEQPEATNVKAQEGSEQESSQETEQAPESNEQEQSKSRRGLSVTRVNSPNVSQQQNLDLGGFLERRGLKVENVNSPKINQQQHIGADGGALFRRGLTVSDINSGKVNQQQNLDLGGNFWGTFW